MTDAFVALDARWRYTYVNARAGEIFGRRPEDLVGKHIWTEFPEGVGQPFRTAYERALRDQVPVHIEAYYPPYDRWLENRIHPHPGGLTILFHDVTARKRAELLQQGQSTVLECIAAAAPLEHCLDLLVRTMDAQAPGTLSSVLLLDEDGVTVRHGAASEGLPEAYLRRIDGITIGPRVGSCGAAAYLRERVFTADIESDPNWEDYRHLALPHGLRACWSTPIISAKGGVLGTFAIYRREPASPSAHHLEIIERATHLACIAIEAHRSRESLRRSNERFDLVIRAADAGIWDWDLVTDRLFLSPRWKKILGYEDHELPSRPKTWEERLHPEDRERALATRSEYLEGHIPTYQVEHRLRHKDGTYRWVVTRGLATRDEAGKPLRFVGSTVDVTERLALQARFHQAQKMELVGRLSAGLAHDFNNVLNVILGFSGLALERLKPSDVTRVDMDEIHKAGLQAGNLARQLLSFTRPQPFEPRILDLDVVLSDLEKMVLRLVGPGVTVELQRAPAPGRVRLDAGRAEQVILNLCANARDALSGRGKITIATADVELAATHPTIRRPVRPGRYVRLSVTDTGCGMPEATLTRIFEPFFTTKEVGKGTGLGLATVQSIIEDADGYVGVESEVGVGSTFSVYLPRIEAPADEVAAPAAPRGSETVVLVEESEPVRELAERLLQSAGYTVITAATGPEALRTCELRSEPIDLLLTNVARPETDARALARQLSSLRPGPEVAYVSGCPSEVGAPAAAVAGEPFTPGALLRKVREILDERP